MNYLSEVALASKVKKVCGSVEKKVQLNVMERYVAKACARIEDPHLRSSCMLYACQAAFRFAPVADTMEGSQ